MMHFSTLAVFVLHVVEQKSENSKSSNGTVFTALCRLFFSLLHNMAGYVTQT